jgi:hypothetical protein
MNHQEKLEAIRQKCVKRRALIYLVVWCILFTAAMLDVNYLVRSIASSLLGFFSVHVTTRAAKYEEPEHSPNTLEA